MSIPFDYINKYFSEEEYTILFKFKNIIIWGYPLHTHTQSYVHASWVKAFSALRDEVFWFHDNEFPSTEEFDYSAMKWVEENHTYIHRIRDLMRAILQNQS